MDVGQTARLTGCGADHKRSDPHEAVVQDIFVTVEFFPKGARRPPGACPWDYRNNAPANHGAESSSRCGLISGEFDPTAGDMPNARCPNHGGLSEDQTSRSILDQNV